ncbi:MAG: RelA/SpoT family protein, partial [Bacilli bacterium]|nr:RelA/SpoT family protein [Bacilli bacterium]
MNNNEKPITFEILYEKITQNIKNPEELTKIKEAYECAASVHKGTKRLNGDDFIVHPLTVANIVNALNVDSTTIIAALLHETTKDGAISIDYLNDHFGSDVATIVDALSKMNNLELTDDSMASAIYLRKVLVGLATDVRVLFIKLADRLHNMRTNYAIKESNRKQKAYETQAVLIPIAHRLGINSIKSELENLCLYYTKPDVYNDIETKLNEAEGELTESLLTMQESIANLLQEKGLKFKIKSRVKSVYSIYNKLSKGRAWNDIYDILALRVILEEESDCYLAMGLIHAKYKPIPKRFKDYIAMPKANMYQSLHTTVIGEKDHLFEIQIRTFDMDEFAEKGMAAHWSYKENNARVQSIMEQKLEMFRNLIETNIDVPDKEFASDVTSDILAEMIYVFTPKGDVIELPANSTPIDFAYRIHSDIGDRTVGAIVNDNIVPLSHKLKNNDIVKINTNINAKPNQDWLNFVKTSQARNKIKAYFSKQEQASMIVKGKDIFEHELRKRKLSFNDITCDENIQKINEELKLKTLEDIYLSIGTLRYTVGFILSILDDTKDSNDDALIIERTTKKQKTDNNYKNDIIVAGVSDIMVNIAKCCMPVKGDEITGFITKGQGITIHRQDCPNVQDKNERMINVAWNTNNESVYLADLLIESDNNKNYFNDIIACITKKNLYIENFKTKEYSKSNVHEITIKVKDKSDIDKIILDLNNLPYVI